MRSRLVIFPRRNRKYSMINIKFSRWYLILALILCGCSVDISQTSSTNSTPQDQIISTSPAASSSSSSNLSQHNKIGNPSLPSTIIPVTWDSLNLTGKLVYQSSVQNGSLFDMSIHALDLATGEITTIFQAPDTSWIDFASVSPDGKQLVMAYLPPKISGAAPSNGQQALYTIPVDGSQPPQVLLTPPSSGDQYFQPVWSPDGKYIYYSHVDYSAPPKVQGQHFAYYEIFRIAYPGGQPEKLVEEAYSCASPPVPDGHAGVPGQGRGARGTAAPREPKGGFVAASKARSAAAASREPLRNARRPEGASQRRARDSNPW